MSSKIKSKLKVWSIAFDFCLVGIIVLTVLALGTQLFFTRGQYSTDLSNIDNWKTLASTFSFPLGVAGSMLAITSLVGLYHRSLQLSLQLEKVEDQLELAKKKENFTLYVEHKKLIIEIIKEKFASLKNENDFKHLNVELVDSVYLDEILAYQYFYPENLPTEMNLFDANLIAIKSSLDIKYLISALEYLKDKPIRKVGFVLTRGIRKEIAKTGFTFNLILYKDTASVAGGPWIINFFFDLNKVFITLKKLHVIDDKDTDKLTRLVSSLLYEANMYNKKTTELS